MVCAVSVLVGCEARFIDQAPARGPSVNADGSDPGFVPGAPAFYECSEPSARGMTFEATRRLTREELSRRFTTFVGSSISTESSIASRLSGLPPDEPQAAGDFSEGMPSGWATVLHANARSAVALGLASTSWRTERLGSCVPVSGAMSDACLGEALQRFAARVYSRPATSAEVTSLVGSAKAAGGGTQGLGFALRRLLQAAPLSFHVETGEPTGDGRLRLPPHEVALRLATLTTGDAPDSPLLEAVASGELETLEQATAQVRRLLSTPVGKARVRDFFRYYMHLDGVPDPSPVVASHRALAASGLGDEMRREALDFAEHIAWSAGENTFAALMTSTAAFPRSARLATVLSATPVSLSQPVASAPSHPGLLHRPALLVSAGARTSPIIRGAHARRLFLCDAMGLPDPVLLDARVQEVGNLEAMPNREKVDRLTNIGSCGSCHSFINQVGYTFERYDQVAMPRAEELIFDSQGAIQARWPIDTRGDRVMLDGARSIDVADSKGLVEGLAVSGQARACFARKVFEYYRRRVPNRATDGCLLAEVAATLEAGSLVDAITALIASEDTLYRAAP